MEVKGTGTANTCPDSVSKNATPEFQNTKLMTRLTYTLVEIEGPFEVDLDGSVNFKEEDGIDCAAVTVQLPGGECVPLLFILSNPKGRGGST
ncbi:predicted protein [Arabidopsis lyrata subsp. lyrata]|uniref:Predicted protein n=1 Tax=Arabidopsis lyrata subsp. lyrata TaxID=81972 RepID=D7KC65_ARALL|nr:predicted protein [Arabidopsis lyrata subsp. lyrata]